MLVGLLCLILNSRISIECHEFSVEDETDLTQLYRDALSDAGHVVDGFIDFVDAYSRFQEDPDRRCRNFRRKDGKGCQEFN